MESQPKFSILDAFFKRDITLEGGYVNGIEPDKRIIMKDGWRLADFKLSYSALYFFRDVEHPGFSLKAIFFLERTGADTV